MTNPPQQPNTLGNASLALVFGIGLCALTGIAQSWIQLAGAPLFVCGGASAFLGFLSLLLGVAGLFGKDRPKATAIVGLVLGFIGLCMFLALLRSVSGG